MIKANTLKLDTNNNKLIIALESDNTEVNRVTIAIDTQSTYIDNGPSKNTIYKGSHSIDSVLSGIEIPINNVNIMNTLFFIYVTEEKYQEPISQPFGTTLLYTLYLNSIYSKMLNYLRYSYSKGESIPKVFVDMYFLYKGLQLSLSTGNNIGAINFYNKLIEKSNTNFD